ncbi:helix-turn-helix domain-containing protein [Paraburkholderia sp. CNPSo 3157]|uniref:Helix-turn-helix domain-containing protein n=1 Tax=Paraburkholderia franconis TaxID=2654983 RepID=A0A7X1NC21_9BURK|nr:helix-turn-helix domain-containing protein [Paraburkholderia franconis]MPW19190.1 helix-turn-helix domain-containing protein [Paraburkholderia franconis]
MLLVDAQTTTPFPFSQAPDLARRLNAGAALHPVPRGSQWAMNTLCNPADLSADELAQVDSLVCEVRTVQRGANLYRANDPFHSVYVLRSGSFKTIVMHREGREQVTGFQISGEILGLDGIAGGQHRCGAVALERSTVCVIPFEPLENLCREIKPMQRHLHRMMSWEIVRETNMILLLGTMRAEQRVAAFLLNLAERYGTLGYSATEFNMRMTRNEIGSYLGITLETASRMFSKLQQERLVHARGKQIRILDSAALARL